MFVGPQDPPGVTTPGDEHYGWLGPRTSKNGMEVELASAWAECTYGMTLGAERFLVPSRKILVVDYNRSVVDPMAPQTPSMLRDAARHLGRLNVLFADNSVHARGPMQIDPLLPSNARLWAP